MDLRIQLKYAVGKKIRYESHRDFLDKCYRTSTIPKGFRFKWEVQLDATSDEIDRCMKVRDDAALKLVDLSKNICHRKYLELQDEVNRHYEKVSSNVVNEIEEWAVEEKVRLDCLKKKKYSELRKLNSVDQNKSRNINQRIVGIVKDGNCFYRCLSQHILGTQMSHVKLREDLVNYMSCNKEKYGQLIDGDIDAHIREQSFTDGRTSSWATEAELAAAADWFDIEIMVSRDHDLDNWERFPVDNCCYSNRGSSMKLLLENNHFSLICSEIPKQDVSNETYLHSDFDWFEMTNPNEKNTCALDSDRNKSVSYSERNNCVKYVRKRAPLETLPGNLNIQGQSKRSTPADTSVTNLSKHTLSKSQISLLEKGLKFIPSRHSVDKVKLLADLSEWERRMRLAEFFYAEGDNHNKLKNEEKEKFKIKKPSTFTPSPGRDKCLDLYIELVKDDIIANLKRSNKLNISKEERAAFYEMLHNKDIVIRPADKGSGIVVVNKDEYISSLQKEMENSKSYQLADCDKTDEIQKKVKRMVGKMNREGLISDDLRQYLIPRYPQKGKLKGNPKLHKRNIPYRTIVSGIGTPTEKLAELAEHELNEYVEASPSYIRDTTDFIGKLGEVAEPIPSNAILFCFDVVQLYPSIPRKEGLEACQEALKMRSAPLLNTESTMEMIQTVLDNNVFGFGEMDYIQKEGVAIGSRLGKNFACAYMRKWDEELMRATVTPHFYKRFIDDGFGIWIDSEEELLKFASFANNIHRNIKVELRYDKKKIEFLDTLVKLESGHIYTDLYVKPTDKQLYLNNSSCHPSNTKRGLAYGLGLRIRRICEKESDYLAHRQELKTQLRKRGYSGKLIESQLQKVDKLDRSVLLLPKHRGKDANSTRVPLVVTYSQLLPNIHGIIRKHLDVLYRSGKMKDVFKDPPLVAYRRDRNLGDTLVHGKTNAAVKSAKTSCQADCQHCSHIHHTTVLDTHKKTYYMPNPDATCKTRNVVYAILCSRCQSTVYVGETERELRERMTEHLRDVRLQRDRPINSHFGKSKHQPGDVMFAVLEKLYTAQKAERLIREGIWINSLSTMKPNGCNIKDSAIPTIMVPHQFGRIIQTPLSSCDENSTTDRGLHCQ